MQVIHYSYRCQRKHLTETPRAILPGPFAAPETLPATMAEILQILTGQTEKGLIAVPAERAQEIDEFIISCLTKVDDGEETIYVARTETSGEYLRVELHGYLEPDEAILDFHGDEDIEANTFVYDGDPDDLRASDIIDQTEDDEFFGDESDEEFHHSDRTNTTEIEEITKAISVLFPESFATTYSIEFLAPEEDGAAHWRTDGNDVVEGGAAKLLDFVLEVLEPEGYTWQYNDGAINRRSGYYKSPESLTIELEEMTDSATMSLARKATLAQQQERARKTVLAFLDRHMADAQLREIIALPASAIAA